MWVGKITVFILLIFFRSVSTAGPDYPELKHKTFEAKVIGITDGDTIEILYRNQPIKIRLAHIDCPEKRGSQPYGNDAKAALSKLCFGQQVQVHAQNYDRYKRLIAVVVNIRKQNVNQEMIKQGMAWHFKKYSKDTVYAQLEVRARRNKIGLWKDAQAVAPWDWRKHIRQAKATHNKQKD
ncbi:thermonuclease family protein [Pedobacter endophyticus]|uniref:Thermonuclease family protein n=1 Tax=Pedobacter endophyticus TaxID=2789740 RepID=A0A7U3SNU0_9SPHI|nr:thermonuclease family protein [Pedobacter endophyticus]QPH37848.1 thermonuclease family protein [Pedobacter endophyticus]